MRDRIPFLIGISSVFIFLLFISGINQDQPYFEENVGPWFGGYWSNPIRIDTVNITSIVSKGNTSSITVKPEYRIIDDEWAEWSSYLGKGRFSLEYTYGSNYTHYSFKYLSNETGVLNLFWDKLQWYMHLSEEDIQWEKDWFIEDEKARDKRAGSHIDDKKPDWKRVIIDMGTITEIDSERVGYEYHYFDSGAELRINTFCVVVEQIVQNENESVIVRVEIDAESDIRLDLECEEQVDNPSTYFTEIFEYLSLPRSLLESIELEERWGYAI